MERCWTHCPNWTLFSVIEALLSHCYRGGRGKRRCQRKREREKKRKRERKRERGGAINTVARLYHEEKEEQRKFDRSLLSSIFSDPGWTVFLA
jgi:hypothetical protein